MCSYRITELLVDILFVTNTRLHNIVVQEDIVVQDKPLIRLGPSGGLEAPAWRIVTHRSLTSSLQRLD